MNGSRRKEGLDILKYNMVHNLDCLEGLRKLPDNSIDIIITSPPYNIGNFNINGKDLGTYAGNNMPEAVYQTWQLEILSECYRVLSPTGSMFYNHKVRIKNGVGIHPLEWLFKSQFAFKQEITWDLARGANTSKIRFFPFSERIYWLTKDPKVTAKNESCLSDVWRIPQINRRSETGHLAVMPEKVVENILDSIEGKTVLDPFAGSGTTLAVAKRYGLDYIGFEVSETYYAAINARLAN